MTDKRKQKKVFVTPEEIQKRVDSLKQIETDLNNSVQKKRTENQKLEKSYSALIKDYMSGITQIQQFEHNHNGIKTKVQLCTYLNRIELKYQTLKKDYAKLQLENERLKTDLKNFELAAEKAEVKEKNGIFHFLDTAFFGLS